MNSLKIYNTASRQVEEVTLTKGSSKLKVYTCGPTVYNKPHIGNWFTFVRYDVLIRALKANNFDIVHVENITDVGHLVSDADEGEDKMQKGARREGTTAWEVASRYTKEFIEGSKELNILPPTHLVKATDHIQEQIELINRLEQKDFTYIIDDGVYFDTSKLDNYGKLAKLQIEQLKAGARVEMNTQKRNHTDFALWKFSPKNIKRDMEWKSPWGVGFPGWHIECSAMAIKYLGETLDIHAGGIDHIPVHHTNEIAQSEAATGKQFARLWVHNHHLLSEGQKIAKSLQNGYTLDDIKARGFSTLDLRMLILQSGYRNDSNFTWESLNAAHSRRLNLQAIADLRFQAINNREPLGKERFTQSFIKILSAINNDLNTPKALSHLSKIEDILGQDLIHKEEINDFTSFIKSLDSLLGLSLLNSNDITEKQKALLQKRREARQSKDFNQADEIRKELSEQNIEVRDLQNTTIWHRTI